MHSLVRSLERHPLPAPGLITAGDVAAARAVVLPTFREYGTDVPSWIIRHGGNVKLSLGTVPIAGLTLTPASTGPATACVNFRHCASVCVLSGNRGAFTNVRRARSARVAALLAHPDAMAVLLAHDIERFARSASGGPWAVRLNVASDIAWEVAAPWLLGMVSARGGMAYDYTKRWDRDREPVPGYRLTYSAAGHSFGRITERIASGANVAVVFADIAKGMPLPSVWHGVDVVDGDTHDVRYIDPTGVVVGLRAKGRAIHSHGTGLLYRADSDPLAIACEGCGADSGEACRWGCLSRVGA